MNSKSTTFPFEIENNLLYVQLITGDEIFALCEPDKEFNTFLKIYQPLMITYSNNDNEISLGLHPYAPFCKDPFLRIKYSNILTIYNLEDKFRVMYEEAIENFNNSHLSQTTAPYVN